MVVDKQIFMKKFAILLLVLVVILLGSAYFKLFSRQSSYFKTISTTEGSVLVLNNFDLGNIKIVTTDKNEISFDLEGDPEALAALDYESDLLLVRFGLSRDWSGISGVIYVPEGTLLDITLSDTSSIRVSDVGGAKKIEGKKSFLVDTKGLNSVQRGVSGEVVIDGWGDVIVWDDETWDLLSDSIPADENDSGGSEGGAVYCGVGSQAIRNYCCLNENADVTPPVCDGLGHWIFSNINRACDYACDPLPEGLDDGNENESVTGCGVGGQNQRNSCCASLHAGEYQGCLGSWRYNNASQACQFDCDFGGDVSDSIPVESTIDTVTYDDPVSVYCSTVNAEEDRHSCCNDSLKNELSTGPRPGFPDCIGTWNFDAKDGCQFECAEQAEMIRILNELKQRASN